MVKCSYFYEKKKKSYSEASTSLCNLRLGVLGRKKLFYLVEDLEVLWTMCDLAYS